MGSIFNSKFWLFSIFETENWDFNIFGRKNWKQSKPKAEPIALKWNVMKCKISLNK